MKEQKQMQLVEFNTKPREVLEVGISSFNEVQPFSLSLAERDHCLMRIENEIFAKKKMLTEKRKHLKKMMSQNRFLKEVANDYQKYYDKMIEQKREQMTALTMLHKYIDGLIQTEKLTAQNIKDAKKEQKKILAEVNKIKGSLDSFSNGNQSI